MLRYMVTDLLGDRGSIPTPASCLHLRQDYSLRCKKKLAGMAIDPIIPQQNNLHWSIDDYRLGGSIFLRIGSGYISRGPLETGLLPPSNWSNW